jgi:putative transposase
MEHERADLETWNAAERRAAALARLPERLSEIDVEAACAALGVSRATLFRWLKRFRDEGRTSALLPRRPGPPQGMAPLAPNVLAVVERHFQDFYATRRRPTRTRLWREIAADCRTAGLDPPSIRRLGRWLAAQDQMELKRRREGKAKSEQLYLATPGGLRAEAPLDIVEIDHTKVDVTVVDQSSRKPIGRPTLTLAIDVATRMAMGFHLSLEPPCLTSVALCLTHAVMDKSAWLVARDIAADWPACGIPRIVHVDNGAEFHALAFERACAEHGVDLTYRPPGTPRFGGHIERLIGTMMGAAHLLPGSHFSSVRDRGDVDPEASATMTLRELETWLALEIVGGYHARAHRSLGAPPNAVWAAQIAAARLRMPVDPRRFLMDFLPAERRVLQRDGLHLFNIRYWSDELRRLMGQGDKVTVKYDPRDLSRVFVRVEAGYVEARPADVTRPAIALWEHRAAVAQLRAAGRRAVDEELIFSTILAQRALVDAAGAATKAARRQIARRARLEPPETIDVTPAAPKANAEPPRPLPYFEVEEWDDR